MPIAKYKTQYSSIVKSTKLWLQQKNLSFYHYRQECENEGGTDGGSCADGM